GDVVTKALTARVLFILSSSLQVGIPLVEALKMCQRAVPNQEMCRRLQGAISVFVTGADASEALARSRVFPTMVTSIVHVGEETGRLDVLLERVTLLYEEEVDQALSNAARLVEPLLLCVAGFMAGFVALASLLPIIQVIGQL
ncbi:MAG: type II secretion system F family protein, partial [Candidatus Eremiobacterota bacterium]